MRTIAALLYALAVTVVYADDATPDETFKIAPVQTLYTCAEAKTLKFSEEAYMALDVSQQLIVDGQFRQCNNKKASEQYVLVANPLATSDNDKVFYGSIKKADLDNLVTNCKTGGAVVGAGLSVASLVSGNAAAGEIGTAVYNYSAVSCDAIGDSVNDGNLMLFLGPTAIVSAAVAAKVTEDIIDNIPVLADADKENVKKLVEKVTEPPKVTIGKNISVEGVGLKVSVEKPKVVVKKPRVTLPPVTLPLPKKVPDHITIRW